MKSKVTMFQAMETQTTHSSGSNSEETGQRHELSGCNAIIQRYSLDITHTNRIFNLKNLKDVNESLETSDAATKTDGHAMKDQINAQSIEKTLIWPETVLPPTTYTTNPNPMHQARIEQIAQLDALRIRKSKLAAFLFELNLAAINGITAADLIAYDPLKAQPPRSSTPATPSNAIAHARNQNLGLLNWICAEFSPRAALRLAEQALVLKDYNTLAVTVQALQTMRLSRHQHERAAHFRRQLDAQSGGLFPFEWLLQDCAESNTNADSEIAALRFCKVIEKLKEMKQVPSAAPIPEKYKQLLLGKMWQHLQNRRDAPPPAVLATGVPDMYYLLLL